VIKFARWPQLLGILSIAAYMGQNNPDVNVEVFDGNNVLPLDEAIARLDADAVGISAADGRLAAGFSYSNRRRGAHNSLTFGLHAWDIFPPSK